LKISFDKKAAKSPLERGFFQNKLTAAKKSVTLLTGQRKGRHIIGHAIEYVINKYLKIDHHARPIYSFKND
jgi:hypothetical protein